MGESNKPLTQERIDEIRSNIQKRAYQHESAQGTLCAVIPLGDLHSLLSMAERSVSEGTMRALAVADDPNTEDLSVHAALSSFGSGCREELRQRLADRRRREGTRS